MMSFPSRVSLGPLEGVSHVCRKVFTMAITEVPGGVDVFIKMSVITAQDGMRGWSRYAFTHIISIASFLEFMSSRFRPPSSSGR